MWSHILDKVYHNWHVKNGKKLKEIFCPNCCIGNGLFITSLKFITGENLHKINCVQYMDFFQYMDFIPKQHKSHAKCIWGYLQLLTVQAFDIVKLHFMDMPSHFGLKCVRKGLFLCLLFSTTEMYQVPLSLSIWLFLDLNNSLFLSQWIWKTKIIFLDLIADRRTICYVSHHVFRCDTLLHVCLYYYMLLISKTRIFQNWISVHFIQHPVGFHTHPLLKPKIRSMFPKLLHFWNIELNLSVTLNTLWYNND